VRRDRKLEQQGFARFFSNVELSAVVKLHVVVALEGFLEAPPATGSVSQHRQLDFDGSIEGSKASHAFEPSRGGQPASQRHLVSGSVDVERALHFPGPFCPGQVQGRRLRPRLHPISSRVHGR
jgi:hypothetical protein